MTRDNICKFSDIKSGDLICSSFVYESTGAQSELSISERYIIGFVTDGGGKLHQSGADFPLKKGYAFFIQNGSSFKIISNGELAYFYVSFYGRRAEELAERFALCDSNCTFDLSKNYEELTSFALNCLQRANGQNTDLLGECGLLYILAHLDSHGNESPDLLSLITTLTTQNFDRADFSLSTLSEMMKYDAKYLSFYFKKHKHICYSEYLRDMRIRHAVFLMEQGLTSVKNIALLSGFGDALYFSKVFKRVMGKSPKEYMSIAVTL